MTDKKTPREWALELGHLTVHRSQDQSLLGEETVEVPSSAYAAAAALHLWEHAAYHARPDGKDADGKVVAGTVLRITKEVFESALVAGTTLVKDEHKYVFVPVLDALGEHTPDELKERAERLQPSLLKATQKDGE